MGKAILKARKALKRKQKERYISRGEGGLKFPEGKALQTEQETRQGKGIWDRNASSLKKRKKGKEGRGPQEGLRGVTTITSKVIREEDMRNG